MPLETGLDFTTGVYRCDDISLLQMSVYLKTIKLSSVPLSAVDEGDRDDKLEEQVLSWQQRVLSPWEIKFYSNIDNCKTESHKKYHFKILEMADEASHNNNIIYSYTSQDMARISEKDVLHGGYKTLNFLERAMRRDSSYSQMEQSKYIPKRNIVELDPSVQTSSKNHVLSVRREFMFIMADTGYLTHGERNEQVLVTLKWEPSLHVLTVFPDFNNSVSASGYELLSDAFCQYFFWVTLSKPQTHVFVEENKEEESDKYRVPFFDIILPRRELLDVYFIGDLRSAHHFKNDNLFIHYYFQLPGGWKSSSDVFGVTHRSKNIDGCCLFNHLFEIHFTVDISVHEKNESPGPELFPQLFLEVVSLDSWDRVRREGSGWVRLLPAPGRQRITVDTWRPASNSRINSMRRFFIGTTPHVADRTYVGVPGSFCGRALSKFGFGTVSSGSVHVDINVVLQSRDSGHLTTTNYLLERLSTANLVRSVNGILNAFSTARRRLLRVHLPASSS